ncbi:UNVERIFIED_ORG: hypothetical protein JN05_02965 [Zoogloea ramigera]|uniref:DUF2987 domain-containing protein n=1 Tax=Duganella zoogloeoides TaxID=75659 RepID=A0ABZ0Y237_9BURK|nr:hypothetical protein [Duganella zoogloeoides]WQH05946.1 hypothetical protein SR858_06310 [Duganella zoogloeoides]
MKKLALLSLMALSTIALPSHAAEREWANYKSMVEGLRIDRFYSVPAAERDKIKLYISVKPVNKEIKPQDVVLIVVNGAERQTLPPLTPEYRLDFGAPNPRWMDGTTRIVTTLPAGEKSAIGYEGLVVLPAGLQWNYATIMGSVGQMNNAINAMAGAMRWFAPSVEVVVFKFAKPATLKVGATEYKTNAKHMIILKPEAALMKANPLMVASERPLEAELRDE